MSELNEAVRRCVLDVRTNADGDITARCVFPPDFLGFKGHFRDRPVLPGVCLVQAVLAMLDATKPAPAHLKVIEVAKFFAPVLPGVEVQCVVTERTAEGGPEVHAQLGNPDGKVAELTLKVAYDSPVK